MLKGISSTVVACVCVVCVALTQTAQHPWLNFVIIIWVCIWTLESSLRFGDLKSF